MAIAVSNSPGNNPTGNPFVDSLIWGSSWSGGTITYSFDPGYYGDSAFSLAMKSAVRAAFDIIETIIPLNFSEQGFLTGGGAFINDVDITYALVSQDFLGGPGSVGFHQIPGDSSLAPDGNQALFGLFGYDSVIFNPEGLQKGGAGFSVILHEILHGLGLAHPHDNGGGSSIFPGVSQPFGDYGYQGQNQGVFTIMSYNEGYAQAIPVTTYTYGDVATPMALDIAALQAIYGTASNATGNNVYSLPGYNGAGTHWSSIWDTGGNDTIYAGGVQRNTVINLNDADLSGSDAGGSPIYAAGIQGGFTIANSVVIENAVGGTMSDTIIGNEVGNWLDGRSGNDIIYSGSGNDQIIGGDGNDTLSGDNGSDIVSGGSGVDNIIAYAGDGNDNINGGGGYDWLRFTGNTSINLDLSNKGQQNTGYGFDTIRSIEHVSGSDANDQITGSKVANILNGRNGSDTLDGQEGDDTLNGGRHSDILIGGRGQDTINGGNGADIIEGGKGLDFMNGGNGTDTFVFTTMRDSTNSTIYSDVISDFRSGEDKIDLSAIDASEILPGDDAFIFRGQGPITTSQEGEISYLKIDAAGTANDRTYVFIDSDADKAREMVIELTGLHDLTANDFIL
ncbi:M10 family metallopeptidase C-terminal domain-containing protein [Ruegeria meonggei]|uniref:M10 family metallopeptidase C-terminal domain-containing protein n=1 Tax=Ruegeria meonggei TaxID=1446476 RepID=UPI00366FF08A